MEAKLKNLIREVPDFPKPGISFKDITPLLTDHSIYEEIIDQLASPYKGLNIDYIAGIESRGFLFGMGLAQKMGAGFIPVRKAGKLPRATISTTYSLEYGEATIELHSEDIPSGSNVIIHDDLLATGGTALAAADLIQKAGGHLKGFSFIIELEFLSGRQKLEDRSSVNSLVSY